MSEEPTKHHATIFLVSGELDKAIAAFEVAIGLAAMGTKVNMWFIFYGINSIRKPRNFLERLQYFFKVMREAPGRRPETDILSQRLIPFLNASAGNSLPLSQLNYLGVGSLLVNYVMKRKSTPSLQTLVQEAANMGISFNICQPCIDILMLDIEDDLIVDAQAMGVSSYAIDVMKSHYNAIF